MPSRIRGFFIGVELLQYAYFFFIALEMHTAALPQVMLNPKINMIIAAVDISDGLPGMKPWLVGVLKQRV